MSGNQNQILDSKKIRSISHGTTNGSERRRAEEEISKESEIGNGAEIEGENISPEMGPKRPNLGELRTN